VRRRPGAAHGRTVGGVPGTVPGREPFPGAPVEGTRGRVLVVDDTAQIRLLLRLNLELEGFAVTEAVDGEECLRLLRDPDVPRPDVVTVDAVMDPRDGFSTVLEMRRDPVLRDLPVVMVTASVQAQNRARAATAGVDAFVEKPFDPATVVGVVTDLLDVGPRR
jgi:CheY-like chemotaxis protein